MKKLANIIKIPIAVALSALLLAFTGANIAEALLCTPTSQAGTGVCATAGFTGVLLGHGTSPFTAVALPGGTTQFLRADGTFATPSASGGVTSFNTRTGAVTLSSGDVTTALTYTPYNATNPSSYITSAGAPVQSVFGRTGTVTAASNDYTFAQIGSTPTTVAGYGISDAATLTGTQTLTNKTLTTPVFTNANITVGANAVSFPSIATTIVGRSTTDILTNKDLTSGTNTFPTFNQNTTGSAAKWTTARNLAGNSVDGSANVAFANKFIAQGTSDAGLSAAQFLGALGTGLVKNTTTTGVLSIASAGTDYLAPAGNGSALTGLTWSQLTGTPTTLGGYGITDAYTKTASDARYEVPLTFSSPLSRSVNTISMPAATTSVNGYLSSTDWNTFNNKQGALTLTTTGTSGASTLVGNTLNIPQYAGSTYTAGTGLTLTGGAFSVNTSQNIATLSNLTSNGLVKTSGGAGTLGIATAGTDYTTPSDTETFTNKTFDTAGTGNVFKINGVSITSNTGTGANVLATSPTLVTPTLGNATMTSLIGNPSGTAGEQFVLGGRSGVTIPVPYLTPTASNQNIAFDVFPKGSPGNGFGNSDYGVAWQDICSTDVAADGTNYECLHIGKSSAGYGNVSMSQGGTGTVRNLELQAFGGNVGIHTNSPTSLFSVGSSSQFQVNSSGAIAAAAGISSSGTIAFSGLSSNGLVKTSGGTGTLSVATGDTDYQNPITLTTTGSSGPATFSGDVLNIPQYSGGGGSYLAGTGLTLTTNTFSVNTSQNISTLSNLTSNGLVVTTGGTGALSIATATLPSGITASSLTSVGTIGTGVWKGTLIGPTYGGTGVNNGSSTITLGGSLITSGAFTTTLTSTATSNATIPAGSTFLATIVPQIKGATQNRFVFGGYSNGVAATNSTVSSGVLYSLPFMVNKTSTVTTIESDIETNVTGNMEMGIYADNGNGLPGALVVDAGNTSTNSLGTRAITGLSTVLTPGQYWVAIVYSSAPGVKGFPNNGLIPTLGMGSTINAASTNAGMVTMSQAYGALPANFSTTPTYVTSAPFPIVGVNLQ